MLRLGGATITFLEAARENTHKDVAEDEIIDASMYSAHWLWLGVVPKVPKLLSRQLLSQRIRRRVLSPILSQWLGGDWVPTSV